MKLNNSNKTPIFHVSRLQEPTPNEVVFGSSFPSEKKKDTNSDSTDHPQEIKDRSIHRSYIELNDGEYDDDCDIGLNSVTARTNSTGYTPGEIVDGESNAKVYHVVNMDDTNSSTGNVVNEMKQMAGKKGGVCEFLCEQLNLHDKAGIYGDDRKLIGFNCYMEENRICLNEGDDYADNGVQHSDDHHHQGFTHYRSDTCFDECLHDSYSSSDDSYVQYCIEDCSIDEHVIIDCKNGKCTLNSDVDENKCTEPNAATFTGLDDVNINIYENDHNMKVILRAHSNHKGIESGEHNCRNMIKYNSSGFSHVRDVTEAVKISGRLHDEGITERLREKLLYMRNSFFPFKRKKIWFECNRATSYSVRGQLCKIVP